MWRQRRWRELLSILEFLPRTSAYAQAMATDAELAEQVVQIPEAEGRSTQWTRSHRDYSPEVEMLSAVFDRLGELIRAVAATQGSRAKPPSPAPRPVSAIERVRRRAAIEKHRRLAARVLRDSG
jgi:hypothetical protein